MLAQKLGLSLPTIKTVGSGGGAAYGGLDFDGLNDVLTIPNNTVYTPTSSGWTISYWIKTSVLNRVVVAKSNASTNVEFYSNISKSTGYPLLGVYGANTPTIWQDLAAHVNVADGNWHHVAFTFDNAASHPTLAFNAVIDGTLYNISSGNASYTSGGTWASPTNTSEPINFGAATPYPAFVGNIDEISIFDSVLTPPVLVDMYNSGSPTDLTGAADLQGWWRNGDTAGTSVYPTIEDYSSVGNDGTMTNMASGDIVTDVP